MTRRIAPLALLGTALLVGTYACGSAGQRQSQEEEMSSSGEGMEASEDAMEPMDESMPPITKATAVLHPTEGSQVTGTVTFTQTAAGIRVVGNVEGLTAGQHGFHVHEYGDCSAPDGTSAGGHFNPDGKDHGAPTDMDRHVGDLGNIMADESGIGTYDRTDTVIAFSGSHSIIGRGVIVHAGEDDFTTQPTGGAGARAACGVIGIAQGS